MINWVMELVDARKPIIEYAGSEPPQEPDMERVRTVQAKIGVHGSREVKATIQKWAKRRNEFFAAAALLDSMQEAERRGVDVDKKYRHPMSAQWKKVRDIRQELHCIVRELDNASTRKCAVSLCRHPPQPPESEQSAVSSAGPLRSLARVPTAPPEPMFVS
jgi:hypothetical protein